MRSKHLKSPLLLLLTALIWGIAFVAQKDGMNYIEPFTYNGIRSLMGGIVLLIFLPLLDKVRSRNGPVEKGRRRDILIGGILCGVVLFAASNLQQFGIAMEDATTNVGKAGFITACYCAFVPILGLFLKKRSPLLVWIGVIVAVVGFFFLCLMDGLMDGLGLGLDRSDLLLLLCSLCFAIHILVVDHYSPLVDSIRMSCVQFLVCGLLCLPCMFLWETPSMPNILACWLPICYAGIMSCGVAYTLQIVGQRDIHPAVASLILSLESVFSVLAGYILMPGSTLSAWELVGCVLVFAAVLMVELAPQKESDP